MSGMKYSLGGVRKMKFKNTDGFIKGMFLVLGLTIFLMIRFFNHETLKAEADEYKYIENREGVIWNVSEALQKSREDDRYRYSNVRLFAKDNTVRFEVDVTNICMDEIPEEDFQCFFVDEKGEVLWSFLGTMVRHKNKETTYNSFTFETKELPGKDSTSINFYDFYFKYEDRSIDRTVNKKLMADKFDVKVGDDITLISLEEGENVNYQWCIAEDIASAGLYLEGETGRSLTLHNVDVSQNGLYYFCKIWKSEKICLSNRVRLFVPGKCLIMDGNTYSEEELKPGTEESTPAPEKKPTKKETLRAPKIKLSKGKLGSQKYVQIKLTSYQGTYLEIELKNKGKFQKLKIKKKPIVSYHGKYRLRYTKGNARLYFRVRTYKYINRNKRYSDYSKIASIQI